LRAAGWKVLRFWAHDDVVAAARAVAKTLKRRTKNTLAISTRERSLRRPLNV
jgi:very-short-patch-repair endonuclease